MKTIAITKGRRRAAMAPLAAILMIPLIAMVAFALDMGYLVLVRTELHHTADAAALAGAQQLMTPYTLWVTAPTQSQKDAIRASAIATAKSTAKTYSAYNQAGTVSITLNDSDIEAGYLDKNGNYTANPPSSQFPNTVRLTARRDNQANAPVSLFFAPVIGTNNVSETAMARATTYTGVINSFKSNSSVNGRVLPMTYDVDHWNNFINTGQDPDGNISTAADGTPQLKVYPSIKYTGNFGELSLDDTHVGSSDIKSWIDYGVPSSGVQNLLANGLIPLSSHNPTLWDWLGNPGTKASTVSAVNDYVGESYVLPLYKAYNSSESSYAAGTGQASFYNYQIVKFVTVKIMPVSQTNKDIVVQPDGYVEPTAVFDLNTIVPAGESSQPVTTFTSPKLTQ